MAEPARAPSLAEVHAAREAAEARIAELQRRIHAPGGRAT